MEPTADFSPVHAIPEQKPRQVTGAIFTNGRDLFGDLRSYQAAEVQVGDLVTVLLNETTQASRTSGLSTNRTTTNDAIGLNQKNSILNKIGFGKGFFADQVYLKIPLYKTASNSWINIFNNSGLFSLFIFVSII
jgi:flagellar L-ring protein precursor FlgH